MGDFRSAPMSYWTQLHQRFLHTDSSSTPVPHSGPSDLVDTATRGETDSNRVTVAEIVAARQTLDSRLDHMVRFLEQDIGSSLTPCFRSQALDKIREAMVWSKQQRQASEVIQNITELERFMEEALKTAFR